VKSGCAAEKDHILTGRSQETQRTYDKAREIEKKIAPDIQRIAHELGGELVGLEYSIKTATSVEDKIKRLVSKGFTEEEAVRNIYDLVRFTQLGEHDILADNARATIDKLEDSGYIVVELDNKYLDTKSNYKGIHIKAVSPDSQSLELQLHSPESLAVKNRMHRLYEEHRAGETPKEQKEYLDQQMREMAAGLPMPKDIEKLRSFRKV
jgi:hypothetical protein